MDEDEFYRKRGMLISNFAYIESLITSCIVANYFKPGDEKQITAMNEDIFESKLIPFEAKKIMLQTVLKKYHNNQAKFPFKTLGDMQDIRNRFAHGVFQSKAMVVSQEPPEYKVIELQIRHNAKTYNADKLFKQYDDLMERLDPYIKKLPGVTVIAATIQKPVSK